MSAPGGGWYGERRAPHGLKSDQGHARLAGDLVGPGPRCIDEHGCSEFADAREHAPAAWAALDAGLEDVERDLRTRATRGTQVALVDGGHIQVVARVVNRRPGQPLRPQDGAQRQRVAHRQFAQRGRCVGAVQHRAQHIPARPVAHEQRGARRKQGGLGKVRRRLPEERTAGSREGAHGGVAVAFEEHRGRAAERPVACRPGWSSRSTSATGSAVRARLRVRHQPCRRPG